MGGIEPGHRRVAEVDSATKENRAVVIKRFAPYYNRSSSAELAKAKMTETRILVSTDVLSVPALISENILRTNTLPGRSFGAGSSSTRFTSGLDANGFASTNNTSTYTTSTTISWLVTFTPTDPNVVGSSHCETSTLTITN